MFVEEKAAGEKQESNLGFLKLSVAMRIGAMIRPQCRSRFYNGDGSCALGAAWEGAGLRKEAESARERMGSDPYFGPDYTTGRFGVPHSIVSEVWERNDNLNQTREQIAEWLESKGY